MIEEPDLFESQENEPVEDAFAQFKLRKDKETMRTRHRRQIFTPAEETPRVLITQTSIVEIPEHHIEESKDSSVLFMGLASQINSAPGVQEIF